MAEDDPAFYGIIGGLWSRVSPSTGRLYFTGVIEGRNVVATPNFTKNRQKGRYGPDFNVRRGTEKKIINPDKSAAYERDPVHDAAIDRAIGKLMADAEAARVEQARQLAEIERRLREKGLL